MRYAWLILIIVALAPLAAQQPDILYYKFDETSGALARNSAVPGQGYSNGVLSGPPVWNTTDPMIPPSCLDNDGQDRLMSTGYSMDERNGNPFTIEFWFRTTGGGYQDFCNDSDSFALWLAGGQLQAWLGRRPNSSIPQLNGGTGLNDGQWHYAALTHNGNNGFTLYWGDTTGGLNSATDNENTTFTNRAFELLYWQAAVPATYDGEMDEFRLWSVERSAAELQANRFNSLATQDLEIVDPNGVFIQHQGSTTFTGVAGGTFTDYTFTVYNTRTSGDVNFTPVTLPSITGANASVISNPTTVSPGGNTTFTIRITPLQSQFSLDINVNNDRSPNPYQLTLEGLVDTGRPEVLYYRFNEGSGTVAYNDATPAQGNNPATFSTGPNWITTGQPLGAAAAGSTASLDTGFSCADLPSPQFTLEFWVRRSGNGTNTICGDGSSFRVYRQNQDLHIAAGVQGGSQDIDTTVNLPNNTWTHIAIVSDPGNYGLRVYQDGVQEFEQINFSFPFENQPLTVFSNGGNNNFGGDLDEFRLWAHARSQAEIAAEMNTELIGDLEVVRGATIPHTGNDALGNVTLGSSAILDYVLNNVGNAELLLGNPCVSYSAAVNCTVNVNSDPAGALVPVGGNANAQVEVSPVGVGAFAVQLEFSSNDPDTPIYVVNITGNGLGVPQIQMERPSGNPIPHTGGDSVPGTAAGAQTSITYTIRNTGSLALDLTGWAGVSQSNCTVNVNNPSATTVAVGATETIQVDITPGVKGAWSFTLEIDSNDPSTPTYQIDVADTAASGGEIDVQRPVGSSIADNGNDSYTPSYTGVPYSLIYTIENLPSATGDLLLDTPFTVTANNVQFCTLNITQPLTTTLAPGGTTTFQVDVTPGVGSPVSFQLVIGSDDVDEASYEINFSAANTTPPSLSVNTGPIGYGSWNLSVDSSPATVHTITNSGGAPLTISAIANAGTNPGDWVFTPAAGLPVVIPGGGTFDISGVFTPSALGARSAILRITSDSGGTPGATTDVAVQGTGTQAQVDAGASNHDFGDINEGVAVNTFLSFTNNGGGDAWIGNVSIIGPDAADFAILNGPFGSSLASSASLSVQVEFTASLPQGARNATLRVEWGQSSTVGVTQTDVSLTANVTQALVGATPGSGNFGSTNIGTNGTAIPFTIENTGTGDANIAAIGLVGAGATEWTLSGVPVLPYTLAPGAANAITVTATFQPTTAGSWTPTLVITWEQAPGIGSTDINIPFSGTATEADVTANPVSHAFGTFNVGVSSSAQTFTFTNVGNGNAWIDIIALGGVDAADFQVTSAPAPGFSQGTGAPNAFTVDVVFAPLTTGAGKSATLTVTWEQAPGILTDTTVVTLSGNATAADVTASPTSHTYATRNINTVSPGVDFDFTNTGSGAAEIISVVLGGADAGEFFVSNTTAINSPFAVSDSFTVSIEYRPTFEATHNATLTVTWEQSPSSAQSTTVVNLSGTATAADVTASPTSHTYATRNINTISAAVDFDFTNTGSGAADIVSVVLGGADAGEFFISNTTAINAPFAASDSFTVSIEYRPTFEATHNATLTVTWEQSPGSPQSTTVVNLSGTATAADVTASPTSHTYATRNINTISPAVDFDFTNTGTGAADIVSVALGGADAGEFFVSNTTTINAPFAVSDSFTVSVEYRPTFEASHTATLIVTWEQNPGSPQSTTVVNLSGTATAADVTASPVSHVYATRNINTISPGLDFDFTNTGTGDADIISVVLGGADAGEFFVSNTTTINTPFAVSDSFTVSVEYRPTFEATHNATLTVTWEQSPGSPQSTTVVNLSGTATAADVTASPTSHVYPTRNINTISPGVDFDFTNTGTGDADVISVVLGGADAGQFFVSNTTTINTPFAVSDSFTVSVEYRPTFEATHNATLTVTWEQSPGSPQSTTVVNLSGTATAADVTASPTSHTYATRNINTISAAVDFDFTNTGSGAADIVSVVLGGADAGQFFVSNTTTINAPFAASDSFTVSVEYRPTFEATHNATLTVTWEQSPGSPQSTTVVNLSGTATAADVTASPTSHVYPTRNINTISPAVDFDFTNTGTGDADIVSVALGGADASEFFVSNTTTINAPFAVSDSFTVSVEYRPTFEATHTATLIVTWEQSPGSSQSTTVVNLSGTATAADVTASPTSHAYATRNINTISAAVDFDFTNTGTGDADIVSVALGGADAGQFFVSNTTTINAPFAVSDSFTVSIEYRPTFEATHNATLTVTWEQSPGSPQSTTVVNLSGAATAADVTVNPTSHTYATRNINTVSPATDFDFANTGSGDADIVSVVLGGADAGQFFVSNTTTINAPFAVNDSFTVSIEYRPTFEAAHSATLTVTWEQSPGSPQSTTVVNLSGTATAADVTASPTSHVYPTRNINTISPGVDFDFTNTGTGDADIVSVALGGSNPGEFFISNTTAINAPFAVSDSFTVSVEYRPTFEASHSATLIVTWEQNPGSPQSTTVVNLSGDATAADVTAGPVSHVFAARNINTTSPDQTFTFTNTGSGAGLITSVALGGTNPGEFSISGVSTYNTPFAVSDSFTVDVAFSPVSVGSHVAQLIVSWEQNPGSPTQTTIVSLAGDATAAVLGINPGSETFLDRNINTQSAAKTFTVSNSGAGDAEITDIRLVGAGAADYVILAPGSTSFTLLSGNTFDIDVAFAPLTAGTRNATLEIEWEQSPGSASSITSATLSAFATQGVITTTPSPSYDYGSANVGTGINFVHQLDNTGDGPATIRDIVAIGGDAAMWSFSGLTFPHTIVSGGNANFTGTFTPTSTGLKSTTLRIIYDQGTGPDTNVDVSLEGTGVNSAVTTPNVLYPSVNQYVTSAPVTHTITNSGAGTAEITQIVFTGVNAGDWAFVLPAPATPLLIGPGGNFQFDATWTPQGPNLRQATLEVYWRNAGSMSAPTLTTATVSGTATYGDVQSTPQSVDYGNVTLGQFVQIAHNIDNLGNGNAQVLSVTIAGAPSDWTLIGAPGSPVNMLPNQTLVVFGRFQPTTVGPQTEQIVIEWTHTAGPVQNFVIDLQGNGVPPSSVTNVNAGPDTGGPVSVSADVNGPVGGFIDVTVEYATGANPGPNACLLVPHATYTISGNQILNVPANTTIQFYWDAYATEGHVTHSDYVLTLTPEISGAPGQPGSSAPFTLQREGGWAQHIVPFENSPAIYTHTAVFDAANDRMVVFGGQRISSSNEVWVYETTQFGSGWRQIFPSGPQPSPRGHAASVYDAANNRMVIFGGRAGYSYLSDTWALDLTPGSETWTQLATAGSIPAGRYSPTMVMDAANSRALVFGGYGGGYFNDVWELDLSSPGTASWTGPLAVSGTPPAGRIGHAAAFDSVNNRMVVFGGYTAAGAVDEVQQLSFSGTPTWSTVAAVGTPGARYVMTSGYDSVNNALLLVSGYLANGSIALDTWYLPLSGPSADTWSQLADDPQSAGGRVYGTAVCDAANTRMMVYGGRSSMPTSSISFLELTGTPGWDASVTSEDPEGRYGAAMAYDDVNDRLVVWGGRAMSSFPSGTWALDRTTPTGTWSTVNTTGTEPSSRYWMAHAYDPAGNRLFIHGGLTASGTFAEDLWELDLDTDTWTLLSPGGCGTRAQHAMVYDPLGDRLIMFGGRNGPLLNDAWQYQIGIGWSSIAVPTNIRARIAHCATMDTGGGRYRALFFQGYIPSVRTSEMWELDLTGMTWTNITPGITPPVRFGAACAPNATGDRVWMHGGYFGSTSMDDTWELDLTGGAPVWTQHTLVNKPIDRYYHNAVLEPSGTLYVGFGLNSNRAVSDLWTLDTISPGSGYTMVNAPTLPPAMVHANVALDETNNRLIAFSGIVDGVHSTGLWQLDLSSPVASWSALNAGGPTPSPRRSASMVFDDSGAYPRMILYGGRQSAAQASVTDEVWELDLTSGSEQWTLLTTTIVDDPGPRTQHTAIIDEAANRMIVFGGSDDASTVLNSVFELDLTTLTWTEITRSGTWPVARYAHSAVYDAPRQRMLVFGGYDGGTALGDVMSLDLTTDMWSVITPSGTAPSARYYHTLVVDPVKQRMLCYGGTNLSKPFADFFEYDLVNDAWSTITPPVAKPAARWAYGAVWDGARSRMVMVGGYLAGHVESQDQGDAADTWFWGD